VAFTAEGSTVVEGIVIL